MATKSPLLKFSKADRPLMSAGAAKETPEPFEICRDGLPHATRRARVVGPCAGFFVDAHATLLAENQHFGVEEPLVVDDVGNDVVDDAARDRLEAALSVGKMD